MAKLVTYDVRVKAGARGLRTLRRRAVNAAAVRTAVKAEGYEIVRVGRSTYAR